MFVFCSYRVCCVVKSITYIKKMLHPLYMYKRIFRGLYCGTTLEDAK